MTASLASPAAADYTRTGTCVGHILAGAFTGTARVTVTSRGWRVRAGTDEDSVTRRTPSGRSTHHRANGAVVSRHRGFTASGPPHRPGDYIAVRFTETRWAYGWRSGSCTATVHLGRPA